MLNKGLYLFLFAYAPVGLLLGQVSPKPLPEAPMIEHYTGSDGRHHYLLAVAYGDAEGLQDPSDTELPSPLLLPVDLDCLRMSLPDGELLWLNKKQGVHFTTGKELTIPELSKFFDEQAYGLGKLPYWTEVVALGSPKATGYPASGFKLLHLQGGKGKEFLEKHRFSEMDFRGVSRPCNGIELRLDAHTGLIITLRSRTAMCMGHDYYSIRILNPLKEIIWEDLQSLGGDVGWLQANIDADPRHELILHQNDHGKKSVFILDPP